MTVWVDAWQMQCCGQPFAVGTAVSWTLRDPDREWLAAVLGPDVAAKVDAAEERHDGVDDRRPVRATVTSIAAIHCGYAPRSDGDPNVHVPVVGSVTLTDVDVADGWTPGRDGLQFTGYLVGLTLTAASWDPPRSSQPPGRWRLPES